VPYIYIYIYIHNIGHIYKFGDNRKKNHWHDLCDQKFCNDNGDYSRRTRQGHHNHYPYQNT
jgi:hypothetical protein